MPFAIYISTRRGKFVLAPKVATFASASKLALTLADPVRARTERLLVEDLETGERYRVDLEAGGLAPDR